MNIGNGKISIKFLNEFVLHMKTLDRFDKNDFVWSLDKDNQQKKRKYKMISLIRLST